MKKLLGIIIISIMVSLPLVVNADSPGPVISKAEILPGRVTAGETVHFVARVTDPNYGPEDLSVGVFFMRNEEWLLITPLHYSSENEVYSAAVQIPETAPNGTVTLYFGARNPAGEMGEPVPRELTIFSLREFIISQARGCLLSGDIGDVTNFHRGDPEGEPSMESGITIRRGSVLLFQSCYDGVWYENGKGAMGTALQIWIADASGDWISLGSDAYHSHILEGAALRHGTAQVTVPFMRAGDFLMRFAVASAVQGVDMPEPVVDFDDAVFMMHVVE